MTSYDFEVDLESLINASTKSSEAVKQKKEQDVEDDVPTESDVGSDTVWKALDDFQDRWERGINDMTDDIEEVAGRLGQVATNYVDFDNKAKERMQKFAEKTDGLETTELIGEQDGN